MKSPVDEHTSFIALDLDLFGREKRCRKSKDIRIDL